MSGSTGFFSGMAIFSCVRLTRYDSLILGAANEELETA
jgi:hypothetical protein